MEKEDLKNKASDKLQSELEFTKMVTIALGGVLFFLVGVCIYGLLMKDNKATFISLLAVAFSTSIIIPINYANIKKIKEELKSRV